MRASPSKDAIVFACANPVPEIWPWEAKEAGARIVGTGRSDFPNQLNNSLVFPAVFRGALDVRARTISDGMAIAAAHELASYAREIGLHDDYVVPRMDEWETYPRVALATAAKAEEEGHARAPKPHDELLAHATRVITEARRLTQVMIGAELIAPPP